MKKLLFLFSFMAIVAVSNAQDGQGQGRRDPAQMKEMMKQRLKDEVKLPDATADSIVNIQMEFQMEARKIRRDGTGSDEEKAAAVKTLSDARDVKLKGLLTADQFKALQEYNEKMRKEREERQKK